ncbi:hypothetical protein D8674_016429 [Pyrus ussuriensis x Pyrus communis]|uniref:Poor homologous synapsis 1 PH domain-containing protein n=1 Tax=Pyrus ussuriensis x Pyrus communis TaxID=2448454 RepID=A0A5N5H9T6_9ROSA|nr:hypothetical protein D8674_016429 [Pyrus ussuriensis x Pyrus communis]
MAGSGGTGIALLPRKRRGKNPGKTTSGAAVRERWEVRFSRFFCYHPAHSTCPDLIPLSTRIRNRSTAGNWVSSSFSLAMLQLAHDHSSSSSDVLLTVCFAGQVEEHYVSNLQYVWPHVSCNPRLPSKGTRAVLVSYRDSVDEAERFMISLKKKSYCKQKPFRLVLFFRGSSTLNLLITDMESEVSSQCEFVYSARPPLDQVCTHYVMTPVQTYTTQILPSFGNAAEHYSYAHPMMHIHNFQQNFPAIRPGFTALLNDYRGTIEQAQSTVSESVNLNSHIIESSVKWGLI